MQLLEQAEGLAWTSGISVDEDIRLLLRELRGGGHESGKVIAEALGWAPSKVSTLKARAKEQGLITETAWNEYLEAGRAGSAGEGVAGPPDF